MAVAIPLAWMVGIRAMVRAASARGRIPGFLVAAWLLKSAFALRKLDEAARDVQLALAARDLSTARRAVARLVSRPVDELDERQVTSAAVESVAENTADSVVGPWLSYALCGLPGAVGYRAVNTLDSMIGYHGRYEQVGNAAARLDDLLNLVPSRLAGLYLVLSAWSTGADARGAWRVMFRDQGLTASPNAGWPMAAMAGALGVRLEKLGHYRLNGAAREPRAEDILRSLVIMRRAAWWAAGAALAVRALRPGREGTGRWTAI
jgi:adenosylcobinamide-phosphate synthase